MRINIIDVKERIAVGEMLTPDQRNFVLDCINETTKPLGTKTISEIIKEYTGQLRTFCSAAGMASAEAVIERFAARLHAEWNAPQVGLRVEHNAPNYLGRIDQIWAFLSLDEGGEGVCAGPIAPGLTAALIAADKQRLDILKPIARAFATHFKKPVRLAKFTKREDVEIYQP